LIPLYRDAAVIGQANTDMSPNIADFPFQNFGGDAQFLLGSLYRGPLLGTRWFPFIHPVSGDFAASEREAGGMSYAQRGRRGK
jgi:hypothetical protein